MGGTATIFLALSANALTTWRDFAFLGGLLFAGIVVAFLLPGARARTHGVGGLRAADGTVDSHVKSLRRKLEQAGAGGERIRSVYGVIGYSYDE